MEFQNLPEDCIANIISFTTPRDACAMSLVSSTIRSAAQSDVAWERFLPSKYHNIIPSSMCFSSNKDLYLYLSQNPILIENGQKSFVLDKANGKNCYMLSARSLRIFCGDIPPCFWRWTSLLESRFSEVAELLCVCSFEIKGRINTCMLSSETLYGAYLVFKPSAIGAYGFEYQPIVVSIEISREGDNHGRFVYLDASRPPPRLRSQIQSQLPLRVEAQPPPLASALVAVPNERGDGWREIEIGDFFNKGEEEKEVDMGVYEFNNNLCKGGIVLQGIEIRPKPKP